MQNSQIQKLKMNQFMFAKNFTILCYTLNTTLEEKKVVLDLNVIPYPKSYSISNIILKSTFI